MDEYGKRVWQPESDSGMDDLAAGDLDGNGGLEFVAGYNGGGGVRRFDIAGRRRWRQDDGNVWHVEIVDANGDGKLEIVHSNAAGQLTVRDAKGDVLSRAQPASYFAHFSVLEWPSHQVGLVYAGDGYVSVVDFGGTVRAHLQTPDVDSLGEAYGVGTEFGGHEYLALTVSSSHWDRTQLFVFDRDGTLRYREVMAAGRVALSAAEADAFLLGCGSRVLRYRGASATHSRP